MRTQNQFASIVAAQARAALPVLSAIPDKALEKPLAFEITGSATSAKGEEVLNGTVTHKGKTYRAAIFGIKDILFALNDVEPKVGLTLNLKFKRVSGKGVFIDRPKAAAEIAVDEAVAAFDRD